MMYSYPLRLGKFPYHPPETYCVAVAVPSSSLLPEDSTSNVRSVSPELSGTEILNRAIVVILNIEKLKFCLADPRG